MFVSVLETLCTDSDTPGPLLPRSLHDHDSPHNESGDQDHWFTSHPLVVSENTAGHLWKLEICFLSYDSQAFYQV